MAFNLSSSIKKSFTSTVNQVGQVLNTNINAQKVGSALTGGLLGGAAGSLLGNSKGALLGAISGGIAGFNSNNLIGQVQNKLQGLISGAEELTGLVDNPLKIVERGAADLVGIVGGEYGLQVQQFRELSDRTAITGEFLDTQFLPSYKGDDSSASKIPNPLRSHNGFNYVITLGILDAAEYNNPELYRSAGGFKNYIIKSSGGNLDKRYQVFDETGGGASEHAEYYIDDINLESVVAPNPNTRLTLGTNLTFSVTEPYSMGNFVQAIIGSANDAGYAAYTQAPFCLKIDFAGWNLGGEKDANFIGQPIFVPIQIINMDFSVSGEGSKYEVKAVPMSETGLADNINKLNSAVRATGTLCHEVLETNDKSVTGAINTAISDMEEAGALAPHDRYIICFPKTRGALQQALSAGTVEESAFTTSPEELELQRRGTFEENPELQRLNPTYSPEPIVVSSPSQIYSVLKTFAEDTNQMNAIGLSPLNEDTNAPGNTDAAEPEAVVNTDNQLVDTASQAAQPADKARDFQFNQGQQLTSVIERMILETTYAAEKSTEEATNGMNKWFRIDTQVFIEEGSLTEATLGRRPKVYVYSILEYEVDEAVTAANNRKPKNTAGLRETAVKEYNYIYTGKNEDVLNFDINFNNAFLMTAYADLGMNTGSLRDPDSATTTSSGNETDSGVTIAEPGDAASNDDPGGSTGTTDRVAESSGTRSNDVRRRVAEMFHDRITNLPIDMVTAEMQIHGDPYFIPQQTGNYISAVGNSPAINQDGTINYMDRSVFCIVNFRTPFDYQVKGATMEFPQIVPGFSGLFQIWAVTNTFSGGKFTQTLKLIRRKGQDDEATTGNSTLVQVNNDAALNQDGVQSDGTVGGAVSNIDCMPPNPQRDDVRNLLPAIDSKMSSDNASTQQQLEDALGSTLGSLQENISTGIEQGVTNTLNEITGISDKALVAIGSVSSARLRGAMGSIRPGDEMNALDVIAAEQKVINDAREAAQGALNNATSELNSVTNAAKARVRSLLG